MDATTLATPIKDLVIDQACRTLKARIVLAVLASPALRQAGFSIYLDDAQMDNRQADACAEQLRRELMSELPEIKAIRVDPLQDLAAPHTRYLLAHVQLHHPVS